MPARIFPATQANSPVRRVDIYFTHALLLAAMSILLIFDTVINSTLELLFIGDTALGPCLAVCFAVILFFAAIAFLQRDMFVLALFAALIAFFLSYYLYFVIGANRPLSFNALGAYYGSLTVVVFFVLARRSLLPATMKIIFYVYIVYLLIYVVIGYDPTVLPPINSQKFVVVLTDPGRGPRLFLHSAAAVYVAMYSIAQLQEKFRFQYILTFALAGFALYLSQSRGIIICSTAVAVLYIMTRRMNIVQYFSFVAYLLVAAYVVYGVFDPTFNPYTFSSSDTSVTGRSYAYEAIVPYIREYPFFGVGLPDASAGLFYYIGLPVFPEDLGIVGIWFNFGLVGLSLLGIISIYLCCFQNMERSSAALGRANARALALAGCVIGLYAVMANTLFTGSALLFSLIVANEIFHARIFAAKKRMSRPVFARKQLRRYVVE